MVGKINNGIIKNKFKQFSWGSVAFLGGEDTGEPSGHGENKCRSKAANIKYPTCPKNRLFWWKVPLKPHSQDREAKKSPPPIRTLNS